MRLPWLPYRRGHTHPGPTKKTFDAAADAAAGAAGRATATATEAEAAAQAEAVRPHVEELAGTISLNPLTPMFEQDFALPVLASLLWFFVFDSFTGVQVITMGATSARECVGR